MKYKKGFKLILITLIIVISSLAFLKVNLKSNNFTHVVEDVNIRYKTENIEQALEFSSKIDQSVKNNKHGYFLIYGKVSLNDFKKTYKDSINDELFINGKKVFKVDVHGVRFDNTFSVFLTNIPLSGYKDFISAISYVKIKDEIYFSEVTTGSVSEIVFKNLNDGHEDSNLLNLYDEIKENYVSKKVDSSTIEFKNSFYENDYKYLKEEFKKDFFKVLENEFKDLLTNEFDLDEFYKKNYIKDKWSFLLDYLLSLSTNENLNEQINNIKNKKSNRSLKELLYALTNFFNEENNLLEEEVIDFTNSSNYKTLKDYNNKIYINLNNYKLHQIDKTFVLPEVNNIKEGYVFSHYLVNGQKYNPLDKYLITNENLIIKEVHKPLEYKVVFLDDNNNIIETIKILYKQTIENFPEIVKEDKVLMGWEDENNNLVDDLTKIDTEMILKPVFNTITEIFIIVDKDGGGVIEASSNIKYKYLNDRNNLHYLYLTPVEGYFFTENIEITVLFDDFSPVKKEIEQIESHYIEFAYDDPYWSKPY